MIVLLTETDWTHIESILGGTASFIIFVLFILWMWFG